MKGSFMIWQLSPLQQVQMCMHLLFYIQNIVQKLRWSTTSYFGQEFSPTGLMFCHEWYPRVSPAISWP